MITQGFFKTNGFFKVLGRFGHFLTKCHCNNIIDFSNFDFLKNSFFFNNFAGLSIMSLLYPEPVIKHFFSRYGCS